MARAPHAAPTRALLSSWVPSMFAPEDNAGAASREPILYISGMSRPVDGATAPSVRCALVRSADSPHHCIGSKEAIRLFGPLETLHFRKRFRMFCNRVDSVYRPAWAARKFYLCFPEFRGRQLWLLWDSLRGFRYGRRLAWPLVRRLAGVGGWAGVGCLSGLLGRPLGLAFGGRGVGRRPLRPSLGCPLVSLAALPQCSSRCAPSPVRRPDCLAVRAPSLAGRCSLDLCAIKQDWSYPPPLH